MATSYSEDVIDALAALLAVSGTNYDLTSRVTLGHFEAGPPGAPWVTLSIASISVDPQAQQAPLSKWRVRVTIDLEGWAAGVTASPDGRIRGASRLASDLCAALGAARGLPTVGGVQVIDVVPSLTALDGDAHGIAPGYGLVAGTVVVEYLSTGRT